MQPLFFDHAYFAKLTDGARQQPRLRLNLNLHPDELALCQRLFNAIEPGSFIPPHRHTAAGKDETIFVLKGRIGLLIFSDLGEVTSAVSVGPQAEVFGAHIPLGTWHTVVALEAGTVIFECKTGPYTPFLVNDIPAWAPTISDQVATVRHWESLFVGR